MINELGLRLTIFPGVAAIKLVRSLQRFSSFTFFVIVVLFSWRGFAQEQRGGGGNTSFEAHLSGGGLVTNVGGVDTTVSMVGVRAVYSPGWGHVEAGYHAGRGSGNIAYTTIPLNYRMDVMITDINAFALIGGHFDMYKTNDADGNQSKTGNGWQLGGGLILDISSALALRGDFELRMGPGRSLFTALALVFRF